MNEITAKLENDKALVFAKALHRIGHSNTLHVYVDGLVLFLEGSSDRHLAVRGVLKKDHPGFAEARVGNDSVFVVPMEVGSDTPVSDLPPLFIATTTSGYIDHRQEDAFSLEAALGLFSRFTHIQESSP